MRKTSTFAVILITFILCLGLACCSTEEPKTKDEIFGFEHADVIREETTTAKPDTEEISSEYTQEDSSASNVESSSNEPTANTTAPESTRRRYTTTVKPTSATAAPTTAPTTVPTTRKPIVTSPPEIEYPTVTTTQAAENEEDKALESELLRLVNAEREKKNLPELKYSSDLAAAADIRARELTVTFSHTRPDGTTCFTVSEFVYGENIAAGQTSPSSVINAWMNSQGHKDNILNETYKSAAIGCYNDGETYYWVLLFGY